MKNNQTGYFFMFTHCYILNFGKFLVCVSFSYVTGLSVFSYIGIKIIVDIAPVPVI